VIQEDGRLAKDVKLIGIAISNNKKQVGAFKTQFRTSFPIFPDEKGDIFLAMEKPGTPMMVVTTPGVRKVLMSHGGLIEDFDKLVKEVREIHKKQ
jgi:hypothetical protein